MPSIDKAQQSSRDDKEATTKVLLKTNLLLNRMESFL